MPVAVGAAMGRGTGRPTRGAGATGVGGATSAAARLAGSFGGVSSIGSIDPSKSAAILSDSFLNFIFISEY